MITLSKENVVDYVKSRLNFFNLNGDIKVSAIGEGSVEEDGDGFINFVYRVSDGEHHLIVKQSTLEARSKGSFTLDLNRYKLEYDAMKICAAIVPDLIPKVRIDIACNDSFVEKAVEAIIGSARHGAGIVGDGKIFITHLEECIRIRTGERGSIAI